MNQAAEMKSLRCELADKELSITDLGKFDPDDFDTQRCITEFSSTVL
jgi:hypothetical protein